MRPRRVGIASVLAALVALAQIAPPMAFTPAVRASENAPKAVFIVGPSNGLTDSNLADAGRMADQAEAAGMDVRRVFFPKATWENVLANVQGASLVVYMGHGYGWPSPYTKTMTESRQNGMGLNSWEGSGRDQYKYYGAIPIKENIVLAPNAVVMIVHGCYAAGNGEPGMAIPNEDLARQRVDNFANGFLAAGAHAVFAFAWNQKLNYPAALMNSNMTIDEMFMSPGGGSPAGFIGWRDRYFESQRTPGAVNHLDPHPNLGYYRAVTGRLEMTTAEWRSGAGGQPTEPPPPPEPADPPEITELAVDAPSSNGTMASGTETATFHPNGDGLDDELLLRHTVTRSAYLDATVTNGSGQTVRRYSNWSAAGTSTSRWNGRDDSGAFVPDGTYTVTYQARDSYGATGSPVSLDVLVLTAIAVAPPTAATIHVADADALARSTQLAVTLNQPANVTWQIVDGGGNVVRTVRSNESTTAGKTSFAWDGRSDSGSWVADGWYRSIVTAQTGLGAYSQERTVFVGAFQVTPSVSSPARGSKLTLRLISTERLDKNPAVTITQPGIAPWTATAKRVKGRKYKLVVTLRTGGSAGEVEFAISGVDTKGGRQSSTLRLPLS